MSPKSSEQSNARRKRSALLFACLTGCFFFTLLLSILSPSSRTRLQAQEIPEAPAMPAAPDGAIRSWVTGLTDASIIYLQTISKTVSLTVTLAPFDETAPTVASTVTLPPFTSRVFTVPVDFKGSAYIEDVNGVSTDPPVWFAANLFLSEQGNNAYSGLRISTDDVSTMVRQTINFEPDSIVRAATSGETSAVTDRTRSLVCLQNLDQKESLTATIYSSAGSTIISTQTVVLQPTRGLCPDFEPGTTSAVLASDQKFGVQTAFAQDAFRGLRVDYVPPTTFDVSHKVFVPFFAKDHVLAHEGMTDTGVLTRTNNILTEGEVDGICVIADPYTDTITLTVTYHTADGMGFESKTVEKNFNGSTCFGPGETLPEGWLGGVTLEANGALNGQNVALAPAVLGRTFDAAGQTRGLWSYTPPSDIAYSRNLAFPAVLNGYHQWDSRIFLYNPGTTPATVEAGYVNSGSSEAPVTDIIMIPAETVYIVDGTEMPTTFLHGGAFFKSNVPLAGTLHAASTKAVRDASDHDFAYEAQYWED